MTLQPNALNSAKTSAPIRAASAKGAVVVDTTLAQLYPIFAKKFSQDWPFILVKSGSKYFTKARPRCGRAADAKARMIVARARELGHDADSFARPAQLAELRAGQSVGDGEPDYFYVISPEESTQGALSAEVKNAQKHDNVQICRISVPEHAEVDGLLAAMSGFFALKY